MKSDFKRYKSAPITEAVIEIRIQPPETFRRPLVETLAESFKPDFPKLTPMRLVQLGVSTQSQPEEALSFTSSEGLFGYRLSKADDSRVLQIRRDGFAYSHMAPYTEWAIFRSEASPLWDKYRAAVRDAKLVRCAVRFINRIDIPATNIEIFDYFTLYPKIPEKLPQQDVMGMAMNLQMPQMDIECVAVINQALADPAKPGHISVVLDIDIFRLGIENWQDSEIWALLDKIRARKNEIFEACITDRTRELIDK